MLQSSHAWLVRRLISIIVLWTHCRACAWLNSWGWERSVCSNLIATCHSIERYPRRVSALPIETWAFTALQMSLFWISELWDANYILKSLGCFSWSRNFRSPNIVATAQPALILWRCETAIDSLCPNGSPLLNPYIAANVLCFQMLYSEDHSHSGVPFVRKNLLSPVGSQQPWINFVSIVFFWCVVLPNALENASQWMLS